MVLQERLYTPDDLWHVAQQPEHREKRFELIDGVIREMAPSSPTNTVIAARILGFLFAHVEANDLGYVTGADGGFILGAHDVRIPDVGFISKARTPKLPDKIFPTAPDLAVEVVSTHDSAREVRAKVMLYLSSGTRLVWVVYPEDRTVDVYRPNKDGSMNIKTCKGGDALKGGDVLPGFALPVEKIFPPRAD